MLALAGYLLHAEYDRVAEYLDPGSKIVLGVIVLVYVYRLVRNGHALRQRQGE
ncbi:hypothetical protein D3C77_788360 [compost metagenome]